MGQELPGMGMGQDTQEKQQLPEQADQEEVKELKLEGDGKEKEEEREEEEKEEEEGGDEGVDGVAFNPDEVKGKKEGEEEEREYDYHEDQPDNFEQQRECKWRRLACVCILRACMCACFRSLKPVYMGYFNPDWNPE